MRQYVLTVICAALLSGVALSLVQSSGAKGVVKLICGGILAVTVLSPLAKFDIEQELRRVLPNKMEAEAFAAQGEQMSRASMAALIKSRTESYILNKAAALGGEITAEVRLSDDVPPVPEAAVLTGRVSPLLRQQLERMMEEKLGIPKENLKWTG